MTGKKSEEINMNKVAIVTDSTAYLPKDVREQYRINMIPLNVVFGEKSYQEEIDINVNEFYQKMGEADELPTTSQPAIGQFVSVFEKLQQEGYEQIVTIHLSSKISGTYQAAISASQLVEGIEVIGIDSEISCAPQAQLALEASTIVEKGQGIDTIIERIKEIKDSWNAYFMVDDLNHLHRGGRLNATQLLMGNLLKIKPILHFVDGRIVPFEKVRTEKKKPWRELLAC